MPYGPPTSKLAGEAWILTAFLLLALSADPQVPSGLHISTGTSTALSHSSLEDVLLLEKKKKKSNRLDGSLLCSIVWREDFHISACEGS